MGRDQHLLKQALQAHELSASISCPDLPSGRGPSERNMVIWHVMKQRHRIPVRRSKGFKNAETIGALSVVQF
jgi:hypothetical protein